MFLKKHRKQESNIAMRRITWLLIVSHLLWSQAVLAQGVFGSVGLVSNVTGKAMIYHEGQEAVAVDADLRTPVVFGDRIQTGVQSLIAVLVGDDTLVSMKELTELTVEEEEGFPKLIKLAQGQICISTKRKSQSVTVKVPWGKVTIPPGSLVGIEVGSVNQQLQEAQAISSERFLHRTALGAEGKTESAVLLASENASSTVTVQVVEGSASLVSQITGKVAVTVTPTQTVQMVKGDIKTPFKSDIVQCQVQNIQKDPQHTAIPEKAKRKILEDQQTQATQLVQVLTVAANFPDSSLGAASIGVNNEVLSTTITDGGGDNIEAGPGDSLVVIGQSFLSLTEPFLIGSPSDTTVSAPPVTLALNGFTGDLSDVNPADALAGRNIAPQLVAQYLNSFRNPDNPDTLLAGIRVESSASGGPASVFGGLALTDSQIEAPVEFAQIGQTGNTQETVVALSGSILSLQDSTYDGQDTFLALRNGRLDAQSSRQPLAVVAGSDSNFTLSQGTSFITTNPSVIASPSGVFTVANGATAAIGGSLIELNGSVLDATGGQQRLVNVTNGSQLTIAGNLVDTRNSSVLIAPGGVLSVVADSRVNIQNDFASVSTSSSFNVPNGLVIDANDSEIDINGYVFELSNGGNLSGTGTVPLVNLNNSSLLEADGIIHVTNQGNQTLSSGLLAALIAVDATSSVTLNEAVLEIDDSTQVTVGSLAPLLSIVGGATQPVPVALVENSQVNFSDDLLSLLNGQTETVPEAGVLRANSSEITITDYVVALANGASLAISAGNGAPVVNLIGSALEAEGLLRVEQPGTVNTDLLALLVDADGGSSVALNEAVLKVANTTGVVVESIAPLVPFGSDLASAGVLVQVENSQDVRFEGDLVTVDNATFAVPGAGVLRATSNSQVTIENYVVALRNGGNVGTAAGPVVGLLDSTLQADGLVRVVNQSQRTLSSGLLDNLVASDNTNSLLLREAVVKVEDSTNVTVPTIEPLLDFTSALTDTGVVALVENSQGVTFEGDLVTATGGTFEVPGAGVLRATGNSQVMIDEYVVALQNGGSVDTTAAPIVQLQSSALEAGGLLKVEQAGLVPTGLLSSVVTADGTSSLSLTEAVLKVANTSGVTVPSIGPLVAFGENLTSTGVVAQVENSQNVTFQGDLVTANGGTFEVPGAGVLRATDNSQVTIDEYVVALQNGGSVETTAGPVVILQGSELEANGLLRLINQDGQTLSTTLLSALVDGDSNSVLGLNEAVVKIEDSTDVTVESLVPAIGFGDELSGEGVVALVENSQGVTFQGDLVAPAAGQTVMVPGAGILRASNGSDVVVEEYVVGRSNTGTVTPNGVPVVTLRDSALRTKGLLRLTDQAGQTVSTALLDNLVDTDGVRPVSLTEAVLKIEESTGVTVESVEPLLPFGDGLTSTGVVAQVDSSQNVTFQGDLVTVNGGTFEVPGAGVLRATDNSQVTIDEYVVALQNGGSVNTAPVVRLLGSTLQAGGLLKVGQPGTVNTDLLASLVDADGGSSLALNEAVVKVASTTGVTVPSIEPLISFGESLTSTGVLVQVENSQGVTFQGDLVAANGGTFTVPGQGVLRATDNSEVTIGNYAVALSNGGTLNATAGPVVTLEDSQLQAEGVLRLTNQDGQTVSTALLNNLVVADDGSQVLLTEAALKIEESTGVTVESVEPFLPFGDGLTPTGVVALVENSQGVTFEGDLVTATGGTFEVPGAGVLRATGNSQVMIDEYVVALQNGGSVDTTAAPIVQLQSSALEAGGLLKVEQAGLVPTGLLSSVVTADGTSSLSLTEAVLKVANTSGVTVPSIGPLVAFGENLTSTGVVAQVENSQNVTFQGDLVTANGGTFEVPGAGVLRATDNSQVTIDEYVVALQNGGSVETTAGPVVILQGSELEANGLLRLINQDGQTLSTTLLSALVDGDSNSVLGLNEAVVKIEDSTDVTVESLVPAIGFGDELSGEGVVALVENSQGVTFQGDLVAPAAGQTVMVPGAGILRASNGSDVVVEEYVVGRSNTGTVTPNGVPVVTLRDSALRTKGLLRLTDQAGQTVSTALLDNLVDTDGVRPVSLTEAVLKIEESTGVTVESVEPLLPFGDGLTSTGVVAQVDSSQNVTFQGDLVTVNGGTFEVPGAGVLRASGSTLTIEECIVALSNGGTLVTNGMPVVTLLSSALQTGGLLRVSQPGPVPVGLLGDLVQLDSGSTLQLTETVLKVTDTTGVTVASIDPLFVFNDNLAPSAVVAFVENSQVTFQGDLVTVNGGTFNVPGAGVLQATDNSAVTIEDYMVALQNGGNVNTTAGPVVTLEGSVLEADGLLRLTNQDQQKVATELLGNLVVADGSSRVTLSEAVLKIEDSTGVTVESLLPVLPFGDDLGDQGVVALVENSQDSAEGIVPGVTFLEDLLPLLNGQQFTVPGAGVLALNNSEVTVRDYVVALAGGANLTTNGTPVARLTGPNTSQGSTLRADGLLRVSQPGSVPTSLLENLVQVDPGSTLSLSEAVLKVANTSGVTVASIDPLVPFSSNLESGAVLAQVENSQDVTFQGDLVTVDGGTFTVPGAGVLRATGSSVTIEECIVALRNGGTLVTSGTSVVTLLNSNLQTGGLLRVSQPGAVPVGLLGNLIQFDPDDSTLQLTETVVKITNTTGVTVASIDPFLAFSDNLASSAVVALIENSQVTFQGDLVTANGGTFNVPGAGVLRATNNSEVTVESYVAALSSGGSLNTTAGPVVTLQSSALEADGLLRLTAQNSQNVATELLDNLVVADGGSQVTLSEAVLKIEDSTGVTVESLSPILPFGENLSAQGVVALVENSFDSSEGGGLGVVFQGDLLPLLNGQQFTVPGAGVLEVNASSVFIADYVVALAGGASLTTNGIPVATITGPGTLLGADGLLRISQPGPVPTSLLGNLVRRDSVSRLVLTESVLNVANTSGVTVASIDPLLSFRNNLGSSAVLAQVENSQVTFQGDLITANGTTFTVPTAGVLRATTGSQVTVTDYVAAESTSGRVALPQLPFAAAVLFGPAVTLIDSVLQADGLLRITNTTGSLLPTGRINDLVDLFGASTLRLTEAVVKVEDSSDLSVFSLLPLLSHGENLGDQGVVALFDSTSVFAGLSSSITGSAPQPNPLLNLTGGTVFNIPGGIVTLVDQALLVATRPLLRMVGTPGGANPNLTAGNGFFNVESASRMSVDVPNDAFVSLSASRLTINGSLLNITGAKSTVNINGSLVNLIAGSTLTINNGFLVSALDGANFSLNGPLVDFAAPTLGGNTFSLTNPTQCNGCVLNDTDFVIPILFHPGAGPANVSISGDNPYIGESSPGNNLNIGSQAILEVGENATVNLNLPFTLQ